MRRFLIFILAHLFLFYIMIVYQAQADEEWTIDKYKSLSYARVSGEVIHGDNLNFFIGSRENCEKAVNQEKGIQLQLARVIFDCDSSFHTTPHRTTHSPAW